MVDCDHEFHRPNVPWGGNTGSLSLSQPLHDLLKGSRKKFPKFRGDGSQLPKEHVATFITTCGVLGVEHKDVSVQLFMDSLQEKSTEWFYMISLRNKLSQITMWNTPRNLNPPNRPRIGPPPCHLTLKSPPVNDTCDIKEPEEEVEIEELEEENEGEDENYLEVEEVDGDTHNGLIEYVDDEDDNDDEEAPSFSFIVCTHA
ncbi:hypothetical protein KI387_018401 [Taxus chinensis]|uniref:Uncharacterized protein n=1 Tax=Taxus chinensis TaxID=29808 RepID=A0AA38GJZ3_TAXCH|nr:hypothetical protein KI387_018401 [Taxus chinensis]